MKMIIVVIDKEYAVRYYPLDVEVDDPNRVFLTAAMLMTANPEWFDLDRDLTWVIADAMYVWKNLELMPIDDDDLITEQFFHFPAGTSRFDIWTWIEETFDVSVDDLIKWNAV